MKVLLTGGAGFIGRPTARALRRAGAEVSVFDLALNARDDITDLERVRAAVHSCDAVVHLAAKVGLGVNLDDINDYVQTNDLGTANVLRAAAGAKVQRLVYASSMVVYGEGAYRCPHHGLTAVPSRTREDLSAGRFDPRCQACGEDLVPGLVPESAPFDPRNIYAATKVHGEHLADSWAREINASVAALRFHNVYGPGLPVDTPYAGVAALFVSRLARREPPVVYEDGRQRRNFVHVDDVAEAVVAATSVDLPPGRTALNIGTAEVHTVGRMAELMSAIMGGPPPVTTDQYRLGDVRHITADCSKAGRVLGWRARILLEDGIADLVPIGKA
ncbi:MAG TPA: NAD-dependent epimerase/dehydratase family protein [Propionibacteriaceae bacterium]|nr:NAD-dependent epimerase/dehydratase family protein [Propionibacteriaceae bacterium]